MRCQRPTHEPGRDVKDRVLPDQVKDVRPVETRVEFQIGFQPGCGFERARALATTPH